MENVIRMHGTGHAGRLPPVVSSLFSVKAAHWRDGIRGTELGARGKERTARQRRVISYGFPAIEGCSRAASAQGYGRARRACLCRHPAIVDRQNSNRKGN